MTNLHSVKRADDYSCGMAVLSTRYWGTVAEGYNGHFGDELGFWI